MNDVTKIFTDTLTRLLTEHDETEGISSGRGGEPDDTLWRQIVDLGLPLLMVGEDHGGADADSAGIFEVLSVAGRHGAYAPVAEEILAGWLLQRHSLLPKSETTTSVKRTLATGQATAGVSIQVSGDSLEVSGQLTRLPWGRASDEVVALLDGHVAILDVAGSRIDPDVNLADEPADTLVFDRFTTTRAAVSTVNHDQMLRMAALARCAQMCGAMHGILELTMQYVSDREQFGRPLKKFQAIQHSLAQMYSEVVAASTATRGALQMAQPEDAPFEAAAAIVRTRMAATRVAAASHQAHGAIGFTAEYQLGRLTKRLWAWRDEYGDERDWCDQLGALVLSDSESGLWERLTAGSG